MYFYRRIRGLYGVLFRDKRFRVVVSFYFRMVVFSSLVSFVWYLSSIVIRVIYCDESRCFFILLYIRIIGEFFLF